MTNEAIKADYNQPLMGEYPRGTIIVGTAVNVPLSDPSDNGIPDIAGADVATLLSGATENAISEAFEAFAQSADDLPDAKFHANIAAKVIGANGLTNILTYGIELKQERDQFGNNGYRAEFVAGSQTAIQSAGGLTAGAAATTLMATVLGTTPVGFR